MKKNNNKQKAGSPRAKSIILGLAAVIVVAAAVYTSLPSKKEEPQSSVNKPKTAAVSATNERGDIVIPIADITEKATFYAYDELKNKLEVIAVKAPDGTIRTAFNTCQVCYSSGRGYYIQEDDALVCQNCGNRFKMDQVQVTRGGCNPIPIDKDEKQVTDKTITISKEFLTKADGIFANWKV